MYNYTSPASNTAYYFNTTEDSQAGAEQACRLLGGHLAIFDSAAEQKEVEAAFRSQGALITGYHVAYWIGLKARNWADFRCGDCLPLRLLTVLRASSRSHELHGTAHGARA